MSEIKTLAPEREEIDLDVDDTFLRQKFIDCHNDFMEVFDQNGLVFKNADGEIKGFNPYAMKILHLSLGVMLDDFNYFLNQKINENE